jgi:predicted NAD-dependent protein-ADP-ribosyltransferase YbiA (DUF1768 family)
MLVICGRILRILRDMKSIGIWTTGLAAFMVSVGCASASQYPGDWWKTVDPATAPEWEILPQSALPADGSEPRKVVLSKRTELGVFSNLGVSPFEFHGLKYASIEGLWQGMKYPEAPSVLPDDPRRNPQLSWKYTREAVRGLVGFEAKTAGDLANENMKKIGIKWVSFESEKIEYKGKDQARHYEIIYAATVEKVLQNPEIKALLLKTRGLELLPDHKQDPNSPPAYAYYQILMKIRDKLLSEENP